MPPKKKQQEPEVESQYVCAHCEAPHNNAAELSKHLRGTKCGEHLRKARAREFAVAVDVTPPTKEQAGARCEACVVIDSSSRTAIELRRRPPTYNGKRELVAPELVVFVPYLDSGLSVERMPAAEFDRLYRPLADYPPGRAAKLYVSYAQTFGATRDAMAELHKLVDVADHEVAVAETKLASNTGKRTVTKVIKSSKGDVEVSVTRKTRGTAASMFKSLIMAGNLTDDQIFAKVKEAYGLDDSKRNYVALYRSQLKRAGKTPPKALRSIGEAPSDDEPAPPPSKKVKRKARKKTSKKAKTTRKKTGSRKKTTRKKTGSRKKTTRNKKEG